MKIVELVFFWREYLYGVSKQIILCAKAHTMLDKNIKYDFVVFN